MIDWDEIYERLGRAIREAYQKGQRDALTSASHRFDDQSKRLKSVDFKDLTREEAVATVITATSEWLKSQSERI